MISDQHVFIAASGALLLLWLFLFAALPQQRRVMLWLGVLSAPFGLAEPLFLPRHWNPPTPLGLGQRTGFSIESVLFCFARAGLGVALYNLITRRPAASLCPPAFRQMLHPTQVAALASPLLLFLPLYFLPWDPVRVAIIALLVGAGTLSLRYPSATRRTWIGAGLFFTCQIAFFQLVSWLSWGYVERVMSPLARRGMWWLGMPLPDLLFAAAFGFYWFSVYERYGCFPEGESTRSELHSQDPRPDLH